MQGFKTNKVSSGHYEYTGKDSGTVYTVSKVESHWGYNGAKYGTIPAHWTLVYTDSNSGTHNTGVMFRTKGLAIEAMQSIEKETNADSRFNSDFKTVSNERGNNERVRKTPQDRIAESKDRALYKHMDSYLANYRARKIRERIERNKKQAYQCTHATHFSHALPDDYDTMTRAKQNATVGTLSIESNIKRNIEPMTPCPEKYRYYAGLWYAEHDTNEVITTESPLPTTRINRAVRRTRVYRVSSESGNEIDLSYGRCSKHRIDRSQCGCIPAKGNLVVRVIADYLKDTIDYDLKVNHLTTKLLSAQRDNDSGMVQFSVKGVPHTIHFNYQ